MSSVSRDINVTQAEKSIFGKNTLPNYQIRLYDNGSYQATFQNSRYVEYNGKLYTIFYTFEGSSGRYVYIHTTDLKTKFVIDGNVTGPAGSGTFNLNSVYVDSGVIYINYTYGTAQYFSFNMDTGASVDGNSGSHVTGTLIGDTVSKVLSNGDTATMTVSQYSSGVKTLTILYTVPTSQQLKSNLLPDKRRIISQGNQASSYTGTKIIDSRAEATLPSIYSFLMLTENKSKIGIGLKDETSGEQRHHGYELNCSTGVVSYTGFQGTTTAGLLGDNLRKELGTDNITFGTGLRFNTSNGSFEFGSYTQEGGTQNQLVISGIKITAALGYSSACLTSYGLQFT